jgi:hypothetical protein
MIIYMIDDLLSNEFLAFYLKMLDWYYLKIIIFRMSKFYLLQFSSFKLSEIYFG